MTRKEIPFFTAVCLLVFLVFPLFAQEKTISLGGKLGWPDLSAADNIVTGSGKFGYDSLMLQTNARKITKSTDLLLAFDDSLIKDLAGNYEFVSGSLRSTSYSKLGNGAALCPGSNSNNASSQENSGLKLKGNSTSLFGHEGAAGSFTIEFWLYPSVAENGETIFSWRSSRNIDNIPVYQMIDASFFSGHMEWQFLNIFSSLGLLKDEIILTSSSLIVPNIWSHHCITFDEETGLLQYQIDGKIEDLQYITSNSRENGTVYTVFLGNPANIDICPKFTGAIDDFRILRECAPSEYNYNLYPAEGGRFETQPILLSPSGAQLLSISAITQIPEQTDIRFFARSGDNFYEWTDTWPEWQLIDIDGNINSMSGIYFQFAAELYTDGTGSKTPSVAELSIRYSETNPPLPPYKISATASDSSVEIKWNPSANETVDGYLVFYGERPGEYICSVAAEGISPIDVANVNSFTLTSLKNGRIYYFSVAAYKESQTGERVAGGLSNEVYARPTAKR